MSLVRIFMFGLVALPMTQSSLVRVAQADEAGVAVDAKNRVVFTEERPDWSRSWVVVSRQAYWPLCYESLDRTEEAAALIGKGKPKELTAALEKVSAWLLLAASAANTDGEEGIIGAAGRIDDAVESIASQENVPSDEKLKNLMTLALLVTAKSHVLRADTFDDDARSKRWIGSTDVKAAETKKDPELKKEIAQEALLKAKTQYRHDTEQSYRHVMVAQAYLAAAEKNSDIKFDADLLKPFDALKADTSVFEMTSYFADEIESRVTRLLTAIAAQRKSLIEKL
ncbi:hypothetical protein Poly51_37910 [Rubripirellula tenax]|uniref:Uncharacterized protein n=1 Tax=Rubripirellula tenax TaxID=2528015 RepID=A0A5C6ET25_9BACT|nr:hypothetical protein [Rubripirellula tenax]TWU50501.1 hypothetical protein Poly51_37910 [Rubripirellula tenax]